MNSNKTGIILVIRFQKLDLIVFDLIQSNSASKVLLSFCVQTGTLTEDGLDLWGVQRVENGR